jgi:hypothetical protein
MLTALALLVPIASNTWYVDAQAVPPGNGSAATPYASIQYALDQPTTLHGDLLLVAPGEYVENVTLSKRVLVRATGAPDETVLRASQPGAVVTSTALEGSGPGGYEAAIVEGLTIDGLGNHAGWGATVEGQWAFLRLDRCIVRGFTAGDAVHQSGTNYFELIRCTITGNQVGLRAFVTLNFGQISLLATIVRGNAMDANFAPDVYVCYASCVPESLLEAGTHNFSTVPGFWNAAGADFHLEPLSPCIDTGIHSFLPPDPDGSVCDVGALTYQASYAPTPTTYCTPKTNSLGCTPGVTWTGTPGLSGSDDFHLIAAPVLNQKFGLYVWGTAAEAAPFVGGTLCLEPPFVRGPGLASGGSAAGSDCTGAFDWHFSQAYMTSKGLGAGAILYAQAWGRAPGFSAPNNSQLSDAIVFQIAP